MADIKEYNQASSGKKNPCKVAKLCEYMPYSAKEAFKRLRTNVLISLGEKIDRPNNIIGIVSAQPSEGKSTVSINLAYSLAELRKSVVLLDCDLRRPSVHAKIGIPQTPGVSDVLCGKENLNNTVICYKSTANSTCFDLIAAGDLMENPSEMLNSGNFRQLLEVLRNNYDVVILDLPPVNAVIDATVVSKLIDGLVVVIRENHCTRFILQDCMEQLKYAKANVLGFVMNGSVNGAGKHNQYNKAYRYDNAYYQYGK